MAKESNVYKAKPLTPEKVNLIQQFVQAYNIQTAQDMQEALKDLMGGTIKSFMEAELTTHLDYDKNQRSDSDNYRNGTKTKKVRSSLGEIEIQVPKDRNSTYQPQIVKNRQKDISDIEAKIINMYGRGMSTRQISDQINEIYGFECSESFISDVTDKIYPKIQEWLTRPLKTFYMVVYIDAIHFSVKEEGVVSKRAAYVVMGVDEDGMKDILSIHIGEAESAKTWMGVLTDLKNRGCKDILILCADGLSGLKSAVETIYPQTLMQRCIVHMIRNTLKYVVYKDKKEFASDLKTIYLAPNEEIARQNLDIVNEKWEKKYPYSMKSWYENWDCISPMFIFTKDTRKIIYTTNAIENLNSCYRRLNRQRSVFNGSKSLLKSLFLATRNVSKKWTHPTRDWGKIYGEFYLIYGDRLKLKN